MAQGNMDSPMTPAWGCSMTPSNTANHLPSGITPQKPMEPIGTLETGVSLSPKEGNFTPFLEQDGMQKSNLPTHKAGSVGGKMTNLDSPMTDTLLGGLKI